MHSYVSVAVTGHVGAKARQDHHPACGGKHGREILESTPAPKAGVSFTRKCCLLL